MKGSWDADRDPLSALRRGDPALFEAFVAAELGTFLAFFRRLGAQPTEAEDLVQELFLKLFRQADAYAPSGRFAAFAFRIARNAWIDHQRRGAATPRASGEGASPREALPIELAPDREAAPGDGLERAEEGARIRRALTQLSEHHRLVFELGVMQELSYQEIARLLEIPEGTVKSRMFYAVRRLREELEGSEAEAPDGPQSRSQRSGRKSSGDGRKERRT